MSINGDVSIMRNGRSISQVSVFNYPEHLNPFYEEDNHKRLRFWKVGKRDGNEQRRNSFSIGGLKDMWAFKSFRLKKKSSTLGINKTSESPPSLRRNIQYDPRSRYTAGATTVNGNNDFYRNDPLRSSLQTVYVSQTSEQNLNGFGFSRNDHYRSTIQPVGQSQTLPLSKRYAYGGSKTPQPHRSHEFGRNETMGIISQGTSQTSVGSTNPFETDIDDDNNNGVTKLTKLTTATPKKTHRTKRRAPTPPVAVHTSNTSASIPNSRIKEDEKDLNSLIISNLTAEIENFVKTTKLEVDASYISDTLPNKSACEQVVKANENIKDKPVTKEIQNKTKMRVEPIIPQRKNSLKAGKEMGHVECIHVHLKTSSSSSDKKEPSRVTSFKTISPSPTSKTLPQSHIKSTEDISAIIEKGNGISISEAGIHKPPEDITNNNLNSQNVGLSSAKPLTATKPAYVAKVSNNSFFHSPREKKDEVLQLVITEDDQSAGAPYKSNSKQLSPIVLSNQLKIVEEEQQALVLNSKINALDVSDTPPSYSETQQTQSFTNVTTNDQPYDRFNWKNSTLATYETNVPPEKRKSVKDIIESINRSQQLLGTSAHKEQPIQSPCTHVNMSSVEPLVTTNEITKSLAQIEVNDSNNNFDNNFKTLDDSQREIKRMFQEIDVMVNVHKPKMSNNCDHNLNETPNEILTKANNCDIPYKQDNIEVFKKSKVNKEVYTQRESSPTASNLDWNPVPKPRRAINTPSPELNSRYNDCE